MSPFTGIRVSGAEIMSVSLACVLFPSLALEIQTLNIVVKFWKAI